jgi:hypothetical protein
MSAGKSEKSAGTVENPAQLFRPCDIQVIAPAFG